MLPPTDLDSPILRFDEEGVADVRYVGLVGKKKATLFRRPLEGVKAKVGDLCLSHHQGK